MSPLRRAARPAVGLVLAALLGSACVTPATPTPTRPVQGATQSSPPAATATATPMETATATPTGDASPTPLPEIAPFEGPLRSYTIICADWGSEPPTEAIACGRAATLGLAVIGGDRAAVVRRLDIGYGDPCDHAGTCPPRRADVRWVVAQSADFDTLAVRIARRADGDYDVFPPVEGPPMPPPAFDAPDVRAPDLGPDAPVELRTRPPVAFCGEERITRPDEFDVDARRCFADGVAAWTPVELVTRDTALDAASLTFVERFSGRGAIEHYVLSGGVWSATDCAISPIGTIGVFVITSPCERHDLHR